MQDDQLRAELKERLESQLRKRITFAELDTGGKIIECPNCHVPFKPHLGNWIADKFPCLSCKANLSFTNSTARTARCPCCNISRPLPNTLIMLVCGGCQAKVIHRKRDKAVKCFDCKHINIPTVGKTYGVRPPTQDPPQVNPVALPQVNPVAPPQVKPVVPPQANPVVLPQVNPVVPPQVNQDNPQVYWAIPVEGTQGRAPTYRIVPDDHRNQVPPQVNPVGPPQVNQDPPQVHQVAPQKVVPPRVYQRRNRAATAETESTASSSFTPRTEIIVVEYPDHSVAEAVRNVATKRVVEGEEDKKEAAGNKKKTRR